MKYGSLFSGIGGFDLGLDRAGMTCAWQVEKDEYCLKVLAKHWPDVTRYKDVKDVGKHNLEPVDLICGGFPCQPHSLAGKRKGAADDRDLWPEYRRIIAEIRPRWVLAENVPGIRTTILDAVLADLEGLGYTWAAAVIPACAVDAPHRRDRVWIVAYDDINRGKWTRNAQKQARKMGRTPAYEYGQNGSYGHGSDPASSRLQERNGIQTWRQEADATTQTPFRWTTEPDVGRVADGVPNRVERLRALGNAVVPQVVEFIGRLILEADKVTG